MKEEDLNQKRAKEIEVLVKPIMIWLQETYGHPHVKVLIDNSNCQLFIGEFGFDCFDHIKD